jgi:heptosyltransferase-2
LESHLITLFSGAKTRITYSKGYSRFIYTHAVPLQSRQAGISGITVADRLGLLAPLISDPLAPVEPKITLTLQEISDAEEFLRSRNIASDLPLIMLGMLGSHQTKTYPLPYMAEVIDTVAEITDGILLFNYIPSQKTQAEELYGMCSEKTRSQIAFEAFAPSLRKFLGLLYHCDALVGNEGGTVNMAKALNVPTFSIYSPWIDTMAWHTFEKDTNVAVHLNDYHPELIKGKSKKELKKETLELYKKFRPELFTDRLTNFLDEHVLAHQ